MHTSNDVVIVMGAAVGEGGQPSPALMRRTAHGIELVRRGEAEYLLVTGGIGKHPPAEAHLMRGMALEEGLAEERIVMEEEGRNTFESVVGCVSIMRERGWTKATVVSDSFHLPRARFLFRSFGIHTIGSAAEGGKETNTLLKWWYFHLRELIAFSWYLLLVAKKKLSIL